MSWHLSTIAAISTPLGTGGVGVIRISGPDAIRTAEAVFSPAGGQPLSASHGYTAHYAVCTTGRESLTKRMQPCFAPPAAIPARMSWNWILPWRPISGAADAAAVLDHGASLAGPGEFTKRPI